MNADAFLARYDYALPKRRIANTPASPRDSAQLLVYNRATKKTSYDTFLNLPSHLPKNAVLVFNDTRVIPAKLTLKKETGGAVDALFLGTEGTMIKAMVNRKLAPGARLLLAPRLSFSVARQDGKYYFLTPSFPIARLSRVLETHGAAPLPPYIKHSPLSKKELKEKYQTVFAARAGSVAAPTAGLHFTKRLMRKLERNGIERAFVTLHVGLGTFSPVNEEHLRSGALHEEHYAIDKKTARFLERAKKGGRPIIAVGTTAARALESAAAKNGALARLQGTTDIFIKEGYDFKFVDGLITNFHVPKSSLLMLVAALCDRETILALYKKALRKKFRFFSFGDGMLIR